MLGTAQYEMDQAMNAPLKAVASSVKLEVTMRALGREARGAAHVLALARRLGGMPARTLIVACEPGVLPDPESDDVEAELSAPVAAAVERLPALVRSLIDQLLTPSPEVVS